MTKNIITQAENLFNNELLGFAKNPGNITITIFEKKIFQKLLKLGALLIQIFMLSMEEKIRRDYITISNRIFICKGLRKTDYFSIFGKIAIYKL